MKVFVAASYSTKVNYDTGEVFADYREWLEAMLTEIENAGHEVFNALRADGYKINDADPAEAFFLDKTKLDWCDVLIALTSEQVSAGVQTEIGYAIAKDLRVIIVQDGKAAWFNSAMQKSGVVEIVDSFEARLLQN